MVIIRDDEYLVLGHLGSFMFFLKWCEENFICSNWFLDSRLCLEFISTILAAGLFLRASVIKSHAVLWIGGARKQVSACNAGDLGSVSGLGRSPGEGKGYPLQYSGLENSMNFIAEGVPKSWTGLSDFHFQEASMVNIYLQELSTRGQHFFRLNCDSMQPEP